ncbi:hypothetical protein DFA_11641 [Cavenderia fasciculata]|uniref:Uncharacterized protein n=1 Tax=Cavenderia fasciculata TaxID=261658 RepID=F4QDT3_CACFS|nr:uncharacterized protein DFA_11641 [Cavenderia fasciculata]EGG13880.1 hypothetical protein DFA_11641 [Cavenderia fasciculata]|eukprot:XP_004350588.1 hypothetical protein DFA_11641 [Cavenderia fasciculata]
MNKRQILVKNVKDKDFNVIKNNQKWMNECKEDNYLSRPQSVQLCCWDIRFIIHQSSLYSCELERLS